MTVVVTEGGVLIKDSDLDIVKTFDCGQCFRFEEGEDGTVSGVAFGRRLSLKNTDGGVLLLGVSGEEYETIWREFLDMDRDYSRLRGVFEDYPKVRAAAEVGYGIHILRQEPWETLCSFIISQNNNIPRIKKIIRTLCESYGEPLAEGGYTFPTPEALLAAGEEGLRVCGCGFRARYLLCAAEAVRGGLDVAALRNTDYATAMEALLALTGVGPKVASCVALFGLCHTEAFPVDVWIKRVLEKYFDEDFDPTVFGKDAGIAQQYLFYYERYREK
ncbi:MAG: DNA-3-methyladenine glycosylase 2 family protein [Clostridia bacterium]|nr:DNA-3-methyladenine glycosylase 2 family protein [Clostridia bacterium]